MSAGAQPLWLRENWIELLETLLPGVAHEISNQDQTILLAAQVLQGVWRDLKPILDRVQEDQGGIVAGGLEYALLREEVPDYIGHLVAGARRIELITRELRSFVRRGAAEDAVPVHLNDLVQRGLLIASHRLARSGVRVETDLAQGLPDVRVRPPLFVQAFLSVVLDARSSEGRDDEPVRVSTSCDAGDVVCTVSARGRGITEPTAGRLATAAAIMELLSGALETVAGSAEATVRLLLPVKE